MKQFIDGDSITKAIYLRKEEKHDHRGHRGPQRTTEDTEDTEDHRGPQRTTEERPKQKTNSTILKWQVITIILFSSVYSVHL
jgi:hypothetical protein